MSRYETEAPQMARTRYASDRGLIARMGATMFLLGLVFTGFIIALYFVFFWYGHRHGGGGGSAGLVVLAAVIGVAVAFGGYYWSDKIALNTARARLVTPQQAPELHGIIDRICALANMPKPRVAISPVSMTIASFLGIIAALLVRFAFYGELFGGGGRGRGGNNNNGNALPIMLIVMVV